jgi:hypothetical protein
MVTRLGNDRLQYHMAGYCKLKTPHSVSLSLSYKISRYRLLLITIAGDLMFLSALKQAVPNYTDWRLGAGQL